jgi:hypothetical protein
VWPFASERIVAATATSSSSNNKQASNAGVVSTHCTHTYGGNKLNETCTLRPHRPLLCATHNDYYTMQTRVLFDVARIHVDIFICGLSVSAIHRSLVPLLACNARRAAPVLVPARPAAGQFYSPGCRHHKGSSFVDLEL